MTFIRSRTILPLFTIPAMLGAVPALANEAPNQIKPGTVWLSKSGERINAHGGQVLFHEGIYYWYGTHKTKGLSEAKHADKGVHAYASTDLVNWEDLGLVFHYDHGGGSDLAHENNADRPKIVYNSSTGQFVLYFKLYPPSQGTRVAFVGVATSTSPAGPFTYKHKFVGGGSPNGTGDFAMYKDSDDKLYHLSLRKPDKACVVSEMRSDYLMPTGGYEVCGGVTRGTEAPALFKRDGKYYFLGSASAGWDPTVARLFVSDSIWGPWQSKGNPSKGINPHNGLGPDLTFGGQSTYVLEVEGRNDAFIAMFDINKPDHPFESDYIWLPVRFSGDEVHIDWIDAWTPSVSFSD